MRPLHHRYLPRTCALFRDRRRSDEWRRTALTGCPQESAGLPQTSGRVESYAVDACFEITGAQQCSRTYAAIILQPMYRAQAEAHVIRAIAMMHIEVEHHDPLQSMPLLGILRGNGDRVEQAGLGLRLVRGGFPTAEIFQSHVTQCVCSTHPPSMSVTE